MLGTSELGSLVFVSQRPCTYSFFPVTITTVSYLTALALPKNNMQGKNGAIYSVTVNKIRCEDES